MALRRLPEDQEAWWARQADLGTLLDAVNDAVRGAAAAGDEREHATQLLERAWVQMIVRDLHGRATALGRIWERFMVGDLELAIQVIGCRPRA